MKLSILFVLLIGLILSNTNIEKKNHYLHNEQCFLNDSLIPSIEWNKNIKLQCSDFRAILDTSSSYDAITTTKVSYLVVNENPDSVTLEVTGCFLSSKSWIRECNLKLLEHEQGHFDIAEISARLIRKKLLAYHPKNIKEITKYLKKVNDELYTIGNIKLNKQYDNETVRGTNRRQQHKWNKKISSKLKQLKTHETKTVVIYINKW